MVRLHTYILDYGTGACRLERRASSSYDEQWQSSTFFLSCLPTRYDAVFSTPPSQI
jgi:hypothetical protein